MTNPNSKRAIRAHMAIHGVNYTTARRAIHVESATAQANTPPETPASAGWHLPPDHPLHPANYYKPQSNRMPHWNLLYALPDTHDSFEEYSFGAEDPAITPRQAMALNLVASELAEQMYEEAASLPTGQPPAEGTLLAAWPASTHTFDTDWRYKAARTFRDLGLAIAEGHYPPITCAADAAAMRILVNETDYLYNETTWPQKWDFDSLDEATYTVDDGTGVDHDWDFDRIQRAERVVTNILFNPSEDMEEYVPASTWDTPTAWFQSIDLGRETRDPRRPHGLANLNCPECGAATGQPNDTRCLYNPRHQTA